MSTPRPARDAFDLLLEVLRTVVDRMRHAGVTEGGVLGGRCSADHLGARDATELDRRHADAAGRGVHEHAIALPDVPEVTEHQHRRQVVHGNAAPSSKDIAAGIGKTCAAGTAIASVYPRSA
jgi:hypothetical protein